MNFMLDRINNHCSNILLHPSRRKWTPQQMLGQLCALKDNNIMILLLPFILNFGTNYDTYQNLWWFCKGLCPLEEAKLLWFYSKEMLHMNCLENIDLLNTWSTPCFCSSGTSFLNPWWLVISSSLYSSMRV